MSLSLSETSISPASVAALLEAAGMGTSVWDAPSGKLVWSAQNYRLLGYEPFSFEPSYVNWESRVHPEDLPHAVSIMDASKAAGKDMDMTYRVIHPNGEIRWLRTRGRFEYVNHQVVGMQGVLEDVTNHEHASAEIRLEKQRLNLVMTAAEIAIFEWDAATDKMYWSDNHFKMFGYPEKFDTTGKHWRDRIHPDDLDQVDAINARNPKEAEFAYDYRIVLPDGTIRWIENKTYRDFDENGKITRIYGVVTDVTTRINQDRERILAEQRTRLALEAGQMAVFDYDYETDVTYWSDENYAFFGYNEIFPPTFDAWWDRVHPDDRAYVRQNNLDALASKKPIHVEYRVIWPDGSVHWLESRSDFEFASDGRPVRLYGVTTMIDEQMKAREALWESEERFRMMADNSPVMVYVTDSHHQTTYINRRWCEYTDSDPEESIGRAWEKFIHPDDVPMALPTYDMSDAFSNFRAEYRVMRFDGVYRWCVSEAVARVGDGGEFLGHIGSIYDIHDARMAREELEVRVEERTTELQAANTELEGFTYTVAHDLRTPLRAITSNSRILLEDYESEVCDDAKELLHRQASAATRMGTLIDDLLEYSRIGRSAIRRIPCDLAQITRSALSEALHENDQDVDLCAPESLPIEADPQLLKLVLANLVSNSIKFRNSEQKLRLEVGTTQHRDYDCYFFRDNGIGFEQEYANKVFLPFERLVRNDDYPGTGIGLANVARIIRRHRGQVWAEGRLGEGATFYFTLA